MKQYAIPAAQFRKSRAYPIDPDALKIPAPR
jgi:hypothetical protein